MEGFVNSDYAGDLDGHKSTSGLDLLSKGTAISWGSKPQPLTTLSTVDAYKLMSSGPGVHEALWLCELNLDVGGLPGAAVLCAGAVVNIKGFSVSPRTKHIGTTGPGVPWMQDMYPQVQTLQTC